MNVAYKIDTACRGSPGPISEGGEHVRQGHGGEWWLMGYKRQVADLGGEPSSLGTLGPG